MTWIKYILSMQRSRSLESSALGCVIIPYLFRDGLVKFLILYKYVTQNM